MRVRPHPTLLSAGGVLVCLVVLLTVQGTSPGVWAQPTSLADGAPPPTDDARYPVTVNERAGYVNASGDVVIAPQFYDAAPFTDGLGRVRVKHEGRFPYGFVDPSGGWAIEPRFDGARSFSEGRAAILQDGEWGFVNRSGAVVVAPQFYEVAAFSEGLAAVQPTKNGPWGYIRADGAWAIQPAFEYDLTGHFSVEPAFRNGLAPARRVTAPDLAGYVNPQGEFVVPPTFQHASSFSEGRAAVYAQPEDGSVARFGYVDTTGHWVIEPQFAYAGPFREGRAEVHTDDGAGVIDATGAWVVQPTLQDVRPFSNGRAAAKQRGVWGYLDRSGTWVVEPQFWSAADFHDGAARVETATGVTYVAPSGARIFDPTDPLMDASLPPSARACLPGDFQSAVSYFAVAGQEPSGSRTLFLLDPWFAGSRARVQTPFDFTPVLIATDGGGRCERLLPASPGGTEPARPLSAVVPATVAHALLVDWHATQMDAAGGREAYATLLAESTPQSPPTACPPDASAMGTCVPHDHAEALRELGVDVAPPAR